MSAAPIATEQPDEMTKWEAPKADPAGKGELAAAMAQTLEQVGRVAKNGRNDFHGYDYALESDIMDAVRGALADNDIAIFPSVVDVETTTVKERNRDAQLVTVKMNIMIVHASGQHMTVSWRGQGVDSGDKAYYKAYTGAMKYFLLKTFLISTGDDPEATDAHGEPTRGAKPTRPQAKKQSAKRGPERKPQAQKSAPTKAPAEPTDHSKSQAWKDASARFWAVANGAEGITDEEIEQWRTWLKGQMSVASFKHLKPELLLGIAKKLEKQDPKERAATIRARGEKAE
jgi:hypothetical protein